MVSYRILQHSNGIIIVLSTNILDRIAQGVPPKHKSLHHQSLYVPNFIFPPYTYLNKPSLKNIDGLDYAGQPAAAGPARVFLNECPNQVPIFNKQPREILRRTTT